MSGRASQSKPEGKRLSKGEREAEHARLEREAEIADYREVLKTEPGKRLLWRLLEQASIFESIWDPSSRIHYNAGRQDFGHELLGRIGLASPEAYMDMMHQAQRKALEEEIRREREAKLDKENDA